MSIDPNEAAAEEFYEAIANELYPEHRVQAIDEFTKERLQSFYLKNPWVMRPAVESIQEGKRLKTAGHHSAALIFFVTAIEVLLKATILKPVVHGLVHSPSLAEIIVNQVFNQSGFTRYSSLLSKLYVEYAGIEIDSLIRDGAKQSLLSECKDLQKIRNEIVHQGASCTEHQSERGLEVAVAVYDKIVVPILYALGLTVIEKGEIVKQW